MIHNRRQLKGHRREGGGVMAEHSDEELADNKLGLKHRRMGVFDTVKTDMLVQHPDTRAYYDGRDGIDYREELGDEDGGEDE